MSGTQGTAADAPSGEGTGHGKVILFGEHAVVHGHAALAGAIALGVTAVARPAAAPRLRIPAWNIDTESAPGHRAFTAMRAVTAELGVPDTLEIEAVATVPARAGLGSSAAMTVAIARAAAAAFGRDVTNKQIEAAAMAGERIFHGTPSGVDAAVATNGGIGLFRMGAGYLRLHASPFRLAVGLSGVPRDTSSRVADVARMRAADPVRVGPMLQKLGELAHEGAVALQRGDLLALGALMDPAHETLCTLGLSTPALDQLCMIARHAGARGAKLTGAGGGGAVIALGAEVAVARAWRNAGFQAIVVEVGV